MKVKISYTIDVDDETRRKIAKINGKNGLATREEIREFVGMATKWTVKSPE